MMCRFVGKAVAGAVILKHAEMHGLIAVGYANASTVCHLWLAILIFLPAAFG
jgi:hypothetical protein